MDIISATAEERDYIDDKIDEFNAQHVPCPIPDRFIPLNYVVKNGDLIIGGINSTLYWKQCLFVSILWVEESYRNKNIGSELLKKAEETARQSGCSLAHLDTFDFQAKDFYLKHGYTIFGELDNCPIGHKRYFLKKLL